MGPTSHLSPSRGGRRAVSPCTSPGISLNPPFAVGLTSCCPLLATQPGAGLCLQSCTWESRGEMPLRARKPGNSYKFNKICLINYSSSPRAWLAAPRSKNWASWAAIAGQKLSESSGLWRWPVGQRRRLQDGHRAEAHGPVGAQGTGVGVEARPQGLPGAPTHWVPQSKLAMSRCSSRKALPWRPLRPDLLLTRPLMLLSCL